MCCYVHMCGEDGRAAPQGRHPRPGDLPGRGKLAGLYGGAGVAKRSFLSWVLIGSALRGSTRVPRGSTRAAGGAGTKKSTVCCWGYHLSLFFSLRFSLFCLSLFWLRDVSCLFSVSGLPSPGFTLPTSNSGKSDATQREASMLPLVISFLFGGALIRCFEVHVHVLHAYACVCIRMPCISRRTVAQVCPLWFVVYYKTLDQVRTPDHFASG